MKFTEFTLDSGLQEGLAEAGYITCMPVQEQVLQNALDGSDLYVQSQTGTGKTAAYLVTILQRLSSDPALAGKKALVMVPTRELAVQVEEEARILGSCMKLKSASFYGGVGYGGQQELLKKGVDVIIGTPGRVIDLQESGTMDLSQVAFLVIDEADRMFDMGFYPDLRTLIKVLPKSESRQTMLFSATLNISVKNLAWEYTIEAKEITIEAEHVTVDEIDQLLFHVSSDHKMRLLLGLIQKEKPESLIVFCNTKRMSEVVAKRLRINGYEADFIIGDLPQSKRLQVIDSFKSGSLKMLVATDVAARGIDVDSLAMVINYDLPNEAENYVHRIGRTARAGKTGKAYSFCSEQDVYNLPAIEKYVENKVPSCVPGEDEYAEDKSANVYIRTDRYDSDYDDEDGGRGRRGDRRDGGHGRSRDDRGRSGPSRGGERRSGPAGSRSRTADGRSRGPDSRRREEGSSEQRPRDGQRRGGYRNQDAERDLSKLSFEDRMAYYKSKYGSDEAAQVAENQRQAAKGATGPQGDKPPRGNAPTRRPANADGEVITKSGTKVRSGSRPRGSGQNGEEKNREARRPNENNAGRRQGGAAKPAGARQNDRRSAAPRQGTGQAQRPARDNRRGQGGRPAQEGKTGSKPATAASEAAQKQGGIGGFLKKIFGKK